MAHDHQGGWNSRQERSGGTTEILLSLCFRVDDHMAVILKTPSSFGADKETMIFLAIKHPLTTGFFRSARLGFSCYVELE